MGITDGDALKRLTLQIDRDPLAQAYRRTPWTAAGTTVATQQEETTINEQMVRQMELRRQARAEKREPSGSMAPVASERRRTCAFCSQRGDHPTPTQCLRALER